MLVVMFIRVNSGAFEELGMVSEPQWPGVRKLQYGLSGHPTANKTLDLCASYSKP